MESDTQLLERWKAGDTAGGNELLARYFGSVRRFFASKIVESDVGELVQLTFAGCVEGAHNFRGDGSFAAYLFSIARRQLYKYLRNRSRDQSRHDIDMGVSSIHALGQSPSSVVGTREREGLVLQALRQVSVEHQTMLELHYWEHLPAPEIAQVLDIQPGAVRVRLHRARKALEDTLRGMIVPSSEDDDFDVHEVARALGQKI